MTIQEITDELDATLNIKEKVNPLNLSDNAYKAGSTMYDIVNPPLTPEQIGVSRPSDLIGESVEEVVQNAVSDAYDMAINNFKEENQNRLPMLPWEEVTTNPKQILA